MDEVDARLGSAALAGPLRAELGDLPEVDREMLLLIAGEQSTPTEAVPELVTCVLPTGQVAMITTSMDALWSAVHLSHLAHCHPV